MSVYLKLFNLIVKTGSFPNSWTTGTIIPIYKKKGKRDNPDNCTGITLLSCFSKLFTSVINNGISDYLESHGMLGEEQAGFWAGYGTGSYFHLEMHH